MYDTIIIGAGPAGISAGIYAARYKINTILFGEKLGGQATEAYEIDNYPGIPGVSGIELMNKFRDHLKRFNIPINQERVESIKKNGNTFETKTNKDSYQSKSLILALGAERKRLEIPGEKELLGKGVGYCATCDAFFFKDKITAVVGGANSAVTSAVQLAKVCKKVYLIYRKDEMTAEPVWIEVAQNEPKIELISKTNVTKINGTSKVESIELDKKHNGSNELPVDGVFIEIGSVPLSDLVKPLEAVINEKGFIVIDAGQATNVPGLFAAGDSTTGSNGFQQIITASAEGSIAANSVFKYLRSIK